MLKYGKMVNHKDGHILWISEKMIKGTKSHPPPPV